MNEIRRGIGEVIRLQTASAAPPTCTIRRQSDGAFWSQERLAWSIAPVANPMVTLASEVYFLDFNQALDMGPADYLVTFAGSTTEYLQVRVGQPPNAVGTGTCVIYGVILNGANEPVVNTRVHVTTIPLATSPGVGYAISAAMVATDEHGYFQVSAIRGTRVRLEIPVIGYDKRVTVPTAASVEFTAL